MRIPRIYLPCPLAIGTEVELDDNAFRHAVQVLRLKDGYQLILFNGEGGEYPATLGPLSRRSARVKITGFIDNDRESPLATHLALGISKGERMDFALQKAVELGVNEITPLYTAHCVVNLDAKRLQKRLQHWQAIIIAACEQSGRNVLPQLHAPRPFDDWCRAVHAEMKLILDPRQNRQLASLARPQSAVLLTVGPEGGFSEQEIDQARAEGFTGLGLGPRVLRTETAALATLAAVQTLWGDLAGP